MTALSVSRVSALKVGGPSIRLVSGNVNVRLCENRASAKLTEFSFHPPSDERPIYLCDFN